MGYLGNVTSTFDVGTNQLINNAVTAAKLSPNLGTNGQVLGIDGSGNLQWTSDPAGQWVTSSSDIYFSAGNVTIGSATNQEKLTVHGGFVSIAEDHAVAKPRIIFSAPNSADQWALFGANLKLDSSGTYTTPAANISGGGWLYKSANSLNAHGTLTYVSAPDTNATASTPLERLRITSGGKVGIGTTSPTELLHVVDANIRISGSDEYNLKLRHDSAGSDSNISQTSDGTLRIRYGSDEHVRIQEDGKTYLRNNTAPATALTSAPVQLIFRNATDHNWDHNEHCGAIIFRKGLGAADNIVAAITGTHTRTGSGMSNEDGGLQIWTSPSANPTVPVVSWEFDHNRNLIGNGGSLTVNSEPDDRDEGQVLIYPRGTAADNDLIWIGTRDTSSSKYRFTVDGDGEVRSNSAHFAGVQRDDANAPTNHFNSADRIRFSAFRGTSDNANYRSRMVVGTASADWDDYRVFYYVDAQDDAAVDYDQDQTISFSGSGRGNFKSNVWSGRVESDEGSPNSIYAQAERGFAAFADDSTDQTTCMARNVADGSLVYYSEVNNEANFLVTAEGEVKADETDSLADADYAECFEWTDGNTSSQERRGMTVVLDGEKVKLATDSDNKDNIIGVVSPNPAVLGDSASLGWHGRYKRDIYGTPVRKEQEWLVWKKEYTYVDGVKTLCAQPDPTNPKSLDHGDVERIKVEDIEKFKAKNLIPDFAITNNIRYTTYCKDIDTTDYDPTRAYIPRKDRKEWDAIGMVGKLIVRRGQPVGTRWLLMKENIGTDTDGTVLDRYLVR